MPRVDFSLYLVTDRHQTAGRPLVLLIEEALRAGARAVQLRERDLDTAPLLALAGELLPVIRRYGAVLFVNDRIDVALALDADGVHLRATSLPVRVARRLVGARRLLGVSVHSADEGVRAESEGADFAVLGPIYATASKRAFGPPIGLRAVEEASRRCRIPVFGIGGVTPARASDVLQAGAHGVAVISSVLAAASVDSAVREFMAVVNGARSNSRRS
jgi:thiamine-phosphate pyrophosphorylase